MKKPFFRKKSSFFEIEFSGLSSKTNGSHSRIVNKDGSFNIERKGEKIHIYHYLTNITWFKFFSIIFIVFTLLNGMFSLLYYITGPENISDFQSKNFVLDIVNLFHFSVQTMTTVGYGAMHPTGIATGVLASVEALIGLLSFALISGLMFGRFSKAQSKIKYSDKLLITEGDGEKILQARVVNYLSHDLCELEAKIFMMHDEITPDGFEIKRYKSLPLVHDKISFIPMNWTLSHKIDKKSPLYNLSKEELEKDKTEFLIVISYFDDSFSKLIQSKTSYLYNEIVYDGKWGSVFSINEKGMCTFELDKLDDIIPV